MKLRHLVPLLGVCALNSCYFNSAQHFTVQAGYNASSKVQDIKKGDTIYKSGSHYYVELPRYRVGKKIYWQISAGVEDDRIVEEHPTKDKELFEVPYDFAMWLTDPQATTGGLPSYMMRVKDAEAVKNKADARLSVAYTPLGAKSTYYNYSSPNAAWWWTGGVFMWLCVDVPMSCAEILADTGLLFFAAFMQWESDAKAKKGSKYGCSVCGGTGTVVTSHTSYYNAYGKEIDRKDHTSTCSSCYGDGWNEAGKQMVNERQGLWPPPWHFNL